MLATLFDVPAEDRTKLIWWSNVAVAPGLVATLEARQVELLDCLAYFERLRAGRTDGDALDLVSLLARAPGAADTPMTFLGNLLLLIAGGNDTTRHSMTGSVYGLNMFPEEAAKLRAEPGLTPGFVSEAIRWQTPLAHMRRTATRDVELSGERIRTGEKVVMWYVSGNRDERTIPGGDRLIVDRPQSRRHLSFGLRHPSLPGQPPGRAAAAGAVGGDPQPPPAHRGPGHPDLHQLQLRQRLRAHAGAGGVLIHHHPSRSCWDAKMEV